VDTDHIQARVTAVRRSQYPDPLLSYWLLLISTLAANT